ncbi:hypothetical protein JB92DRAFT_3134848 [Gautieria morchelliformis]|nr:hypothetical protein JB92DRAFT_3134848 [Gautieria morchelliformis]
MSALTISSHDIAHRHTIHSLAPEILGEIFIRCLPPPWSPVSLNEAPLLLLQICHHWRQTVRGTPRLWTDLNMGRRSTLSPVKVFRTWLDNAGALPLKVHLPMFVQNAEQDEEIIELLLDNFHRMLELKGSLTPWFSKFLLRHTLPIHAPDLKRLSVGGWDKLPSPLALERLRRCIIAPQLQACALHSSRFQLSLLNLDPTRLRELSGLWVIEVAEFEPMEILTSFTSLEYLTIVLHAAVDVSVLKIPPRIPIPSLRRLSISTYPGYDPSLFLGALDVVCIEHLELDSTSIGDSPLGPLLDALTCGTIPPLKSLSLSGHNVTASEYMPWIRRFTQLETLTLGRGTLDVEASLLLTCYSSSSPDPWVCPSLSTLVFKRFTLPWEMMEDLVQSRSRATGGCLRKVTFEDCDGLDDSHRNFFITIQESSCGLIQIDFMSSQAETDGY